MDSTQKVRINRGVFGLLIFGALITVFASVVGAFLLFFGYTKAPTATQPIWKFGQWMLFFGLINFSNYILIYFSARDSARGRGTNSNC